MITYSPKHRVKAWKMTDGSEICDLSNDIISISVNKAYGRAFGTFQITTTFRITEKERKRYDEILKTNDVITIELSAGDGKDMEYVMHGLVDRVARTYKVTERGTPMRAITISGRDFGKILTSVQLGWDISGIQVLMGYGPEKIAAAYLPRMMQMCSTPAQMFEWVYGLFLHQLPDSEYTGFISRQVDTDDAWVTYDPTMAGLRGTDAWSAMKRAENPPYNTLTTRIEKDGTFNVILEKTPIDDKGKLTRETFHKISETDIFLEDVGVSDAERTNLLCLWAPAYQMTANGALEIALAYSQTTEIDTDSCNANGIQANIIEPTFGPGSFWFTKENKPDDIGEIEKRKKLFWSWYKNNHEYESGTYGIHGRPEIRPGDGLIHTEYDKQYLIEQVMHNYEVWPEPSFVTTMHVTRGQSNKGEAKKSLIVKGRSSA